MKGRKVNSKEESSKCKSGYRSSPRMKQYLVLFLLIFLILPVTYQRGEKEYKLTKETPKNTRWTEEQISKFQKELALIQQPDLSYFDWWEQIPYKEALPKGSIYHLKPDLVLPGSFVTSDLYNRGSSRPSPMFIPNAIPGDNPPIFIPIYFASHLKLLNYLQQGESK